MPGARTAARRGEDPARSSRRSLAVGERGVVASAGPRYFGFVIGGSLPAALAADWLTTAWDQDAVCTRSRPAGAVAEEVAGRWLLELFDLPRESSVGFTTGGQMANFVGLAAARRAVLLKRGWDVEQQGLQGAPPVRVVVGGEAHVTAYGRAADAGLRDGDAGARARRRPGPRCAPTRWPGSLRGDRTRRRSSAPRRAT